jgi:hypothetical protein
VVRDLGLGGAHAGGFPGMFACTGGSESRALAVPSTAGLEENAKALYQVLAPYERAATLGILHGTSNQREEISGPATSPSRTTACSNPDFGVGFFGGGVSHNLRIRSRMRVQRVW